MKKVNVLMSTYNGEAYIGEQMASILNQDYPNIEIYIRDDGSTDGTCGYLKKYEGLENVHIEYGDNIGFLLSFQKLLLKAETGDYWAFSDQDDIWYKDKVSRAVDWMDRQGGSKPLLYQCSYYIVDEKLDKTGLYAPAIKDYDLKRGVTENIFSGFASMLNGELRTMMLRGNWEKIQYHDCWMTLIGLGFGSCFFDSYIGAEHRRLTNSVSEEKLGKRIAWGIQSLFKKSPLKMRNQEFYAEFYQELDTEKQRDITLFAEGGVRNQLKKVFYPGRWRTKLSSEIVLRGLMLLNKV